MTILCRLSVFTHMDGVTPMYRCEYCGLRGTEAMRALIETPCPPKRRRAQVSKANETQVGGTHYKKHTIQPWDAIVDWELGFLDGNVVKYVARWRNKDGVEDLEKARHYLDKLIELERERRALP